MHNYTPKWYFWWYQLTLKNNSPNIILIAFYPFAYGILHANLSAFKMVLLVREIKCWDLNTTRRIWLYLPLSFPLPHLLEKKKVVFVWLLKNIVTLTLGFSGFIIQTKRGALSSFGLIWWQELTTTISTCLLMEIWWLPPPVLEVLLQGWGRSLGRIVQSEYENSSAPAFTL